MEGLGKFLMLGFGMCFVGFCCGVVEAVSKCK